MNIRIHPDARAELLEAVRYYERQRKGLGREFRNEVNVSVQRIRASPMRYAKHSGQVRRHLVHRFPYGVFYRVLRDHIEILAIAHLRRRPGYWKYRE